MSKIFLGTSLFGGHNLLPPIRKGVVLYQKIAGIMPVSMSPLIYSDVPKKPDSKIVILKRIKSKIKLKLEIRFGTK